MARDTDKRYGTSGTFRFSQRDTVRYLECMALGEYDFITHGFCTRWGGTSEGKLANLNFGTRSGDTEEHLLKNREILCSAFDMPEHNLVTVDQVHGNNLLIVDEKTRDVGRGETLAYDGIISALPGVPVGIKTADCVPVFLADPEKRVIGAVHAGWKGTSLGLVSRAANVLMNEFSSTPTDILAVIGPSIGPCCYEVDGPVFHHFDNNQGTGSFLTTCEKENKRMLDLSAANRSQLLGVGLPPGNIFSADICTSCNKNTFFSHRGEGGDTGRQLSFIMLK